ncbi:TIM barrel protein [Actinomadura sp. LD22]|uniref:TIM barrel protein n=1 Tax=Actinomadura physcomitrii TaxID=2650748 RepID=A0A6I4MKF0_9ACTN|nr:TIM barrel protein [Actinomadura physcomitrii]MWA03179.1 TIM barrel protein [Actinomadura physcomitrii]
MSAAVGGVPSLTLACGSLGPVPFAERAAAAHGAGFSAIGLSLAEYDRLRDTGSSDADLLSILADHALVVSEVEAVVGFAAEHPAGAAGGLPAPTPEPALDRILRMGERLGARRLQVLGTFGSPVLEADAVARFAALCDRAAGHGLTLAIEFIPGTNIPDAATAAAIVGAAGRANGGVCVDSWHHFRGHPDEKALRRIPAEHIAMLQINDGPLIPQEDDYLSDTKRHRSPPGTGEFDLVRLLQAVSRAALIAPVSVEVLSQDLAALPPAEAASLMAARTRAVLAAAGVTTGPVGE